MSWECECGIVNKDSRAKCSGCGTPQGMVWTPQGFIKTPDEAQALGPVPPSLPADAPNFSALPVTIHKGGFHMSTIRSHGYYVVYLLIGIFSLFEENIWVNIIGGLLVLAMCYLLFPVLRTRRTVRIDQNDIRITTVQRGVTKTLVEQVSAYKGVLLYTESEPYYFITREYYKVILVHPDREKTVLVYQIPTGNAPEKAASQVWTDASNALNLLRLTDSD